MGKLDELIKTVQRDAYQSVMKAFSLGELSWSKDSVLTMLRKELAITSDEHDMIKLLVMQDDHISSLRDGKIPAGAGAGAPAHKKQKTSHAPPPPEPHRPATTPSRHAAPVPQRAPAPKMPPPKKTPAKESPAPYKTPSSHAKTGGHAKTPGSTPGLEVNEMIGKRVQRCWDGEWCEAVISDYNPGAREHCLIYEYLSANESWEWVKLSDLTHREIKYLSTPKVDLTIPASGGTIPNKGAPKSAKKGPQSKGAKPKSRIDTEKLGHQLEKVKSKDGLEGIKTSIMTREQEILAQLEQLQDSDDSDAEN
jgi:hypothetical protein